MRLHQSFIDYINGIDQIPNQAVWNKQAERKFFSNFINEQAEKGASRVEKKIENHKRAGSFIRDCRVQTSNFKNGRFRLKV